MMHLLDPDLVGYESILMDETSQNSSELFLNQWVEWACLRSLTFWLEFSVLFVPVGKTTVKE